MEDIFFIMIIFVLISAILFIFVEFYFFRTIKEEKIVLQEHHKEFIPYDYIPTSDDDPGGIPFDTKYILMVNLKKSINAFKENIDKLTQPLFYDKEIEKFIYDNHWYIPALKVCHIVVNTNTIQPNELDFFIEQIYGTMDSDELYVTYEGKKYYVILEYAQALKIYLNNKDYISKIFSSFKFK